jgi:peptidylprolyl isomerase/FKBP-type peptidyl-prolyl cis-trans isomerase FkpA
MPQDVKGPNADKPETKVTRPGQRQQERMQRVARRRKRNRIITAIVLFIAIIAAGIFGDFQWQGYVTTQANHATATAVAHTNATATAVTKNCFVSGSGKTTVPSFYETTATPTSKQLATSPTIKGTPVSLSKGVKYVDLKVGTGATAASGKSLTVNTTGWLNVGCTMFYSTYSSGNSTFTFKLGNSEVIPGWDIGAVGMKVGGIRRLFIPSAEGYGSSGSGSTIPANADLVFDIELVSMA